MHNKYIDKEIISKLIDPLVAVAVEERPPSSLESNAQFHKRLKKSLLKSFHDFQDRLEDAVKILDHFGKWPNDARMEKTINFLQHREELEEEIRKGRTLQDIVQFTNEELINFYKVGLEMYNKQSYREASNIFLLLTQLNTKIAAFWSALGGAEEKCGELQEAMMVYLLAAELEVDTLAPYLHGAKCLLLLHRPEDAQKVLNRALERAEENQSLRQLKNKAQEMLKAIH